jgi:hypothetical protein
MELKRTQSAQHPIDQIKLQNVYFMKKCNTCNIVKALTEFRIRLKNKDNRKGWCANCESEYQRKKHLERKQCREVRHF